MSSDDSRVVPFVRAEVVAREYDEDVKERCRLIWSTVAGRNAERTLRWYIKNTEEGTPAPTARTIRHWAQTEDWERRWLQDFQQFEGALAFKLAMDWYAAQLAGVQGVLDVQAGLFDDNPMAGALRLKAAELPARMAERKVVPLIPAAPAQESTDWDNLSLDEREAIMRDTLQKRKKAQGG